MACVCLLPSLFALHVWRPVCKPTLGGITFQVRGTSRVSKACEEQVSRFSLLDYKPHVGRAKRRVSVFWCLREYLGVNKIMRGYVVKENLQMLRVAIPSPCYREVKCQISSEVLRQTSVFFQNKKCHLECKYALWFPNEMAEGTLFSPLCRGPAFSFWQLLGISLPLTFWKFTAICPRFCGL